MGNWSARLLSLATVSSDAASTAIVQLYLDGPARRIQHLGALAPGESRRIDCAGRVLHVVACTSRLYASNWDGDTIKLRFKGAFIIVNISSESPNRLDRRE